MKKQLNGLMVLILFFVLSSQVFAGTATIDSSTKYQTISGFGASSQWVESKITSSLATAFWADDQVNGHAGLSIIRLGIDDSGNSNWGTACGSATQALNINPNVRVFASPWSPPAKWKNNNATSGNNTGNTNGNPGSNTNQLSTSHYSDYATYLTNFVKACKSTYGFNLYALSVQNEPDYDVTYDSCLWSASSFDSFIGTYLGPALATAGFNNIIMMPESFACNMNLATTTMGDANAAKYVRAIGQHLYGGGPNPIPASYSTTAGHTVELWETETSEKTSDGNIDSGIYYANQLHKCVVDNNYNAYCYWWLVNMNSDDEGLCDSSGNPTKRLYTLGNYSKFVKPGYVRIGATEAPTSGLSCSAYQDPNTGKFAIVVINQNSSATSQQFNLSGLSATSVTPWITDANNNLVQQSAVTVSGGSFTVSLPAQSVMSFVGTSGGVTPVPTTPVSTSTPVTPVPTITPTNTVPTAVVTNTFTKTNTPVTGTPTFTATIGAGNKQYCFTLDYSAVPADIFKRMITLNVSVGTASSCNVTADGSPVICTYTASTGTCSFSLDKPKTSIVVTAVNWTSGGTGVMTKATLWENKKWAYSFTFDDGYATDYTLDYPMFSAKNMRAGMAIVTNWIGGGNYMSRTQVDSLYNAGWSVFNHSTSHPQNTINCSNLDQYVGAAKTTLESWYPTNYKNIFYVYPYLETGYQTCLSTAGYVRGAEGVDGLNYADTFSTTGFYGLYRHGLYASVTSSQANAWADAAATNSRPAWMIVFTHMTYSGSSTPGQYDTNESTLSAHINYVYSTYGDGSSAKNMWFAPSDEVLMYMFTKQYLVINSCTVSSPTNTPIVPTATFTKTNTPIVGTATFTTTSTSTFTFTFTGTATLTPTGTAVFTSTFTPTGTATPYSVMLDDMEDGNNINNWGGNWYCYSGTGTTITPVPYAMTAGGMTGSLNYRASILATVADYAGLGTNLSAAGTAVDLTQFTAVEFYVKGNGGTYWFQFTQPSITDGDQFGVTFTAPATWTKVTIPIAAASLGQRGFGTASTFTKNAVIALQWTSNGNGALDIQVDNVRFLSLNPITPSPTPTNTNIVIPQTNTFTATLTATNTAIMPSITPTNTAIVPTATPTTPVPTFTATNTAIVPTATPTTPVPTNTAVVPTATPTTPVPTNTAVIPTSTPTTGISSIKLNFKSGDNNNSTNSPHPQFRVINTGSTAVNLNTVEVRYWLNYDATAATIQAWVDWAGKNNGVSMTNNVQVSMVQTTKGGQTHYMSVKFTGNVTLNPNEYVEVQARFNKSDWSQMVQSNDWSYLNTQSWTDWNKVTAYVNGGLVYGNEPAAAQAAGATVAKVLTYPNPATGTGATLTYQIAAPQTAVSAADVSSGQVYVLDPSSTVSLGIYTAAGRLIWKTVLSGTSNISVGDHAISWDGKTSGGQKLAAGMYTLKVELKEPKSSDAGFSRIIMIR